MTLTVTTLLNIKYFIRPQTLVNVKSVVNIKEICVMILYKLRDSLTPFYLYT